MLFVERKGPLLGIGGIGTPRLLWLLGRGGVRLRLHGACRRRGKLQKTGRHRCPCYGYAERYTGGDYVSLHRRCLLADCKAFAWSKVLVLNSIIAGSHAHLQPWEPLYL